MYGKPYKQRWCDGGDGGGGGLARSVIYDITKVHQVWILE